MFEMFWSYINDEICMKSNNGCFAAYMSNIFENLSLNLAVIIDS